MFTDNSSILVAYDGSELSQKALKYAENIAKSNPKMNLHILTVKPLPVYYSIYTAPVYDHVEEEAMAYLKNLLKTAVEQIHVTNPVETHLLTGAPAKTIVDFTKEHQIDLIIMGSRGLGSVKELFLGSVSHYVVQSAKCPVLIIK
jgi:nucleotide-binding universal stress UspA family protein